MSGPADFLTKQVGPLPMGAWLLVGGGGLFIASRRDRGQLVTDVREVPVPVGAIASPDGAPVVITPIFRLPELPAAGGGIVGPAPVGDTAPPATSLPGIPSTPSTPPAAPIAPSAVLRPSGNVVQTNTNPYPYPTTKAPNGALVVRDGSGREWVTLGSRPGVSGYVWNRNLGVWQRR